jgi:hypothetical protein
MKKSIIIEIIECSHKENQRTEGSVYVAWTAETCDAVPPSAEVVK